VNHTNLLLLLLLSLSLSLLLSDVGPIVIRPDPVVDPVK